MHDTSHERRLRRGRWLWNGAARFAIAGRHIQNRQEPLWKLAAESLQLRPGHIVLDLGCGPGSAFPALRAAVGETGRVVGVDLSPRMLAAAAEVVRQHGWDNVELQQLDVCRDALEPERYDAVLASFVLAAVPDLRAAVDNLFDALRPGGRVFVGDMSFGPHPAARMLRRTYQAMTAGAADDVETALRTRFGGLEPVIDDKGRGWLRSPERSWPPVGFAVTTKD
jgi:ubiquinone/menaquinone biosynthesis C-methylase UbiE